MSINYPKKEKYRILIIGANGMIGHMIFDYFCNQKLETIGLVRRFGDNLSQRKSN